MIEATLSQISEAIGGQLVGDDLLVSRVYTDSRDVCDKGLFVALKGPNFDAHNFLAKVKEQGGEAAVVEQRSAVDISQIIVKDTRIALGQIAKFNRSRLKAKFAAITGSNGKTTVKEMLASILQNVGETYATQGNFNNEIGAPLTLLQMNESHEFGVIELGANHAGEIDYTASITQPDVAVINNVAGAHLEGFGDLQGVARAKGEIYTQLNADGVAIVNNDDDFAAYWAPRIKQKMIKYSMKGDGDLLAKNISLDENLKPSFDLDYMGKSQRVNLSLAGEHNVNNALSAAGCALALGVSLENIAIGLSQAPHVTGRLMIEELDNGCRLIDDTYNANLDSMRAAINVLASYSGRRILVVGDMAELGEYGRQSHEEIGQIANQAKLDALYSCGVLTQFSHSRFDGEGKHFTNQNELIKQLKQEANANTTILCKGSRSAHMERVIQALMDDSETKNESVASPEGEK
ncbi:UDP-N-acetylmuramoyl-tripeptide--D-alanyl-D-alanine ligase [Aliikangiella marina]|uniref:UDP-N-acetylmuramoyl-tripeptide--D-alanyl-D-alanine ligase n=1 Tax=Aliikangiella marina TaxID=1712262 RepID=A0A545TDI0_9GAMM|nr:UDP-N-acetylmuramoyl-tripeptide--D-alanyl-D-alanine ligase [Aliikangiella marina]TQV75278.1 UDP-N-acetylmuramoyl-tripeptide--D-alanyl-D-alanine ligase [Aliikangiella marina]